MDYRWLEPKEIDELVNPEMERRGWAKLNVNEERPTCRVLGAFTDDGVLFETLTFQLYPLLGPLVKHTESADSGEVSRRLAAIMYDFLESMNARDFMAVANSPVTARICERFGMSPVTVPVYAKRGHGGR
jgi:hypothetical protein